MNQHAVNNSFYFGPSKSSLSGSVFIGIIQRNDTFTTQLFMYLFPFELGILSLRLHWTSVLLPSSPAGFGSVLGSFRWVHVTLNKVVWSGKCRLSKLQRSDDCQASSLLLINLFCLFDHMLCSCILSYSNVDPSPFEFDVVVGDDPSTNCNRLGHSYQ